MRVRGFTLIEILVALTLASLVISLLCELFLANQRSLKVQLALSALEARTTKITAILRNDIHRASRVTILDSVTLQVDSNIYFIEKSRLIVTGADHRKINLVEHVSDMHVRRIGRGIDVSLRVAAGSLKETLHVFTALK